MNLATAAPVVDDPSMAQEKIEVERELIEVAKVLDIYPAEGCVQLRARGLRTTIEYVGCRHQLLGVWPRIYANVRVLKGLDSDNHAFYFRAEGSEVTGFWPGYAG